MLVLSTTRDIMTQSLAWLRASIMRNVGWLEFNRPPVNAFTREMVDETHDAIAAALGDPAVRVLVLASAVPRYFSAGADLHASRTSARTACAAGPSAATRSCACCAARPSRCSPPSTAPRSGGGLEMTLHCDLRFAATDARLGQPEINIGFIPPIATTQALARLIGRPRAMRYLYEGALVPAAEALDWGLLDELVEPAGLRARVQAYGEELAAQVAGRPRRHPPHRDPGRRHDLRGRHGLRARERSFELVGTPDFAEGVDAFLAKRQPKWKTLMTSLAAVDFLDIQVIVDNVTDSLSSVPSFIETELGGLGRRRGGAWVLGGNCLCCAAHGLSCLLTVKSGGRSALGAVRHRDRRIACSSRTCRGSASISGRSRPWC